VSKNQPVTSKSNTWKRKTHKVTEDCWIFQTSLSCGRKQDATKQQKQALDTYFSWKWSSRISWRIRIVVSSRCWDWMRCRIRVSKRGYIRTLTWKILRLSVFSLMWKYWQKGVWIAMSWCGWNVSTLRHYVIKRHLFQQFGCLYRSTLRFEGALSDLLWAFIGF